MIFFDNASTTKTFDEAAQAALNAMTCDFFNPSALYAPALKLKNLTEQARLAIASKLCAEKGEIYFTSCATESNNWILNSGFKNKKGNIVVTMGEHASVYETAVNLKSKGLDVRFVKLLPDSTIDLQDLENKTDQNTCLASVIHVSNETGSINDIKAVCQIVKSKNKNALIHSDGVQAFCKMPTDVKNMGVDFYTLSAHKIGGTKGIGALYIDKKRNIAPFITGGGQEGGLRSGTENTLGILGFGAAVEAFKKYYSATKTQQVYDFIYSDLTKNGWIYNGCVQNNSGFVLSVSMPNIKSEILQHMLSEDGILIGLGSACSSKQSDNRVLSAIGRDKGQIEGNIRISLSVFSTMDEASYLCQKIALNLNKLKSKTIG